jgi:hypothetical protein
VLLLNAERAIISSAKLRDYLLDPAHDKGGSKARVLLALGYERQKWQLLERDIREQHLTQDAAKSGLSEHGETWRIEALLRGPSGEANMYTVWIYDHGSDVPRLITAYPAERRRR